MLATTPYTNELLTEPKFGRGKRIKVWVNGEAHCYEFNINPKDFRSWTSILLHVTNTIQPTFGAVRKLIALSSLKTVNCFDELDPKERYVALGTTCRFKMAPGGYRTSSEKELYKREKVAKRFYAGEMNSKVLPFLIETEKKRLTVIYMTVNGRSYQTPQKIVLNSNDMRNWGLIFKYLTKILDMPDGIGCICTIFGDILRDPIELQHGYLYVAVPFKEHFVPMDYMSLFEEHHSKYRSSYTLTIRPAPSPQKIYSAIRKIKKRISTAEFFEGRVFSRPRDSNCLVKKENLTRCDSQPTTQVTSINNQQAIPVRCDSQPGAQVTSFIQEELARPMNAYENTVAAVEKRVADDTERITTCINYSDFKECQLENCSTSNQTSFAALAAFPNSKGLSITCGSQSESTEDPPTYTVITGKPLTSSGIVSECNVMTLMDTQLCIHDNVVAVEAGEYFQTKHEENEASDNRPDLQQSTVVIRKVTDSPKSQNGILIVQPQATPTIHIRNRTDISIYNLNTPTTSQYKSTETNSDKFETENKHTRWVENKGDKFKTDVKKEYNQCVEQASQNEYLENSKSKKQKSKSKTFTLNSNMAQDNTSKQISSVLKVTNNTETYAENSDVTDNELYQINSQEYISSNSSDAEYFRCGKGDNSGDLRRNISNYNISFSKESDPIGIDYKIKENILEIKDVRKSIQKRIGIGSFRVSTPEVENCLRFSLGDGKYIKENISRSMSADSIETK